MNLMKVKFKWRTQHLDLDPNDPAANDETDVPATQAPLGTVTVVDTIRLYFGNGYWYVNENQTWWPWQGHTTFKVRVKKTGTVNQVLGKDGSGKFQLINPISQPQPPGLAHKDMCMIEDGDPPHGPPAPCRWVVQGGKAYRIC